jgi:MFS family permease
VLLDLGPLRRYPAFRRVFLGTGVIATGVQLSTVAISLQVFDLTRSNLDVGYISLVQLVPAFLGSVFGGAFADAIDRRKLLIATSATLAVGAAALGINASQHHPSLVALYVIAAVNGGIYGADGPSRVSVLISMVDREDLVPANALRQLMQQSSIVIGPALGGVLIGIANNVTIGYWASTAAIGGRSSACGRSSKGLRSFAVAKRSRDASSPTSTR